MLQADWLMRGLMYLVPMVLSLTVHEWAHAWSAYRLGDDTAAREGRLTLNPLPHIDPVGTILAPLLHLPFGWAKPVPVNATRFRRGVSMRAGLMITALAGPLSNLVLALVGSVVYGLLVRAQVIDIDGGGAAELLKIGIMLNVMLAVFNLLPIPPLDGSRVADGLIPYRFRPQWERFVQISPLLLLGLLVLGGSLLARPILFGQLAMMRLISAIAGA